MIAQEKVKHVKGDGVNTPDLKLFAGAYMTVIYWQADPQNRQQPTIYIHNDNRPADAPLIIHPRNASRLVQVLSVLDNEIG